MNTLSLSKLSTEVYPTELSDKYSPLWSYRLKFLARGLFYKSSLQKLVNGIDPTLLATLCKRHNRFIEKPFRPYITNAATPEQRVDLITQHYQFISNALPLETREHIFADDKGLQLISFLIEDKTYSLNLAYHGRFQKEGELSLVLFDERGHNIYTVTFVVSSQHNQRNIVIGGIQGPASNDENNLRIKRLTKTLHGQRPKDLMIKMMTFIANCWQADHLLAIKNESHSYCAKRYRSKKYGSSRIKTDYNRHWEALGGTEYDTHFYQLQMEDVRRDPEDISRPKRAMYRRRYEWLDQVKAEIQQIIALKQ
ncbi:VirK/YbjX family protein [Photobacterium leiognathi]|uniref:VirK/YbjX family protein n=1 Tax=Photobacterium leiognathi TaxID=553611 RepID=UPI002980C067|nr:VirK/YbjX family protein [Photobacterium leiognathi]